MPELGLSRSSATDPRLEVRMRKRSGGRRPGDASASQPNRGGNDVHPVAGTEPAADTSAPIEVPAEAGEERPAGDALQQNLLDRLLYKGVLPRYAFPTDFATFYVFDKEKSSSFRPEFLFSPSQGLPVALSQYAPGKEIWIAGKQYTSGAIYSPMKKDRYEA